MTTRRLKIGIDIDGVLITMDPKEFLDFCAQELGWKIDFEKYIQTHSWYEATGQSDYVVISRAWGSYLKMVENAQSPIEGAHSALKELNAIADIYLITARSSTELEVTEDVLRKFLPDVPYVELSMNNMRNKTKPIIDFGIDYYIDDSYTEIVGVLNNKDVQTKVIPFPSFHGTTHWEGLEDERLIWLKAWDSTERNLDPEKQKVVFKNAWEEIKDIILKSVTI